jgi:hypothetical protein
MNGSLFFSVLVKIKEYLQASYRQLPLYMMATLFALGIIQTNMAYIFFTLGCAALFTTIWGFQLILEMVLSKVSDPAKRNLFTIPGGTTGCSILSLFGKASDTEISLVTPSYFIGFLAFFASYIISNAVHLYTRDPPTLGKDADPELQKDLNAKVDNRKQHATIIMILVSAFTIVFTGIRLIWFRSCERAVGVILGGIIGTGVGIGWFQFLDNCWGSAFSDLFGITSRINVSMKEPMACVYKA